MKLSPGLQGGGGNWPGAAAIRREQAKNRNYTRGYKRLSSRSGQGVNRSPYPGKLSDPVENFTEAVENLLDLRLFHDQRR